MPEILIHKIIRGSKSSLLFIFLLIFSFEGRFQYLTSYPATKTNNISDNYFGKIIQDKYRWLENDLDSAVSNWVKSQNAFTENYFSKIPYRSKIEKNIENKSGFTLDIPNSTDKYSLGLFSYGKNSGKKYYKNYNPILYCRTKFEDWEELINPLEYRKEPSENVIITDYKLSPENNFLCFNISRNGSDWNEIRTFNMDARKIIGEPILWVKFSDIIWYKNGFFYQRFDPPTAGKDFIEQNANYTLLYHSIGDPQSKDFEIKIEGFSDAELVGQDKLVVYHTVKKNSKSYNVVSFLSLNETSIGDAVLKTFIIYPTKKMYHVGVVHFKGDSVFVNTNLHASNGIIARYAANELNRFDTLVKEYNEVLTKTFYFKGKLNCLYEKDFTYSLVRFSLNGEKEKVHLFPQFSNIQFTISKNEKETYCLESSFDRPKILYKFYFETFTSSLVKPTEIHYEPRDYEIKLIEYTASDGVKIPMTLFYRKDTKLTGHNPVLLSAYGGYGIIKNPTYDLGQLIWAENSGIYAVAHVRGGGEKGKKWHFAGSGLQKQKSINDYIDAAKFLIEKNYTTKERLAGTGASNGGLLVAAAAMQAPDLFKAIAADVGVYDMLRYQNFTIGSHWKEEYGLSSDSVEFQSLIRYSPLHTVNDTVVYPAMLITTGDHDDRVPPFHSYKYVARLQENLKAKNPVFLYVEKNSGHSGFVNGKNRYKKDALMLSFLFYSMNIQPKLID